MKTLENSIETFSSFDPSSPDGVWKLWIYTNYDCNLRCSYCLASSSPAASRRAIGVQNANRLVDEALQLGFGEVFFTGGEPFLLDEIYAMLAYSAQRVKTTVLTNAILLKGRRLDQLCAISNENLTIQVSLDGGSPAPHDAYRGAGSWVKTVEGIRRLLERGFHVRLSTTETPANSICLGEVCAFHRSLGIPEEDHLLRKMARRGFALDGLEVGLGSLMPELTANLDGLFWHPISTDPDMQVAKNLFPLSDAMQVVREQMAVIAGGGAPRITFT